MLVSVLRKTKHVSSICCHSRLGKTGQGVGSLSIRLGMCLLWPRNKIGLKKLRCKETGWRVGKHSGIRLAALNLGQSLHLFQAYSPQYYMDPIPVLKDCFKDDRDCM